MADVGDSLGSDDPDPQEVERDIRAYIEQANSLDGPAVEVVAGRVAEIMLSVWDAIERDTSELPVNKLIAVMLSLSSQARELDADESRHWCLLAGSTIVSGLIGDSGR